MEEDIELAKVPTDILEYMEMIKNPHGLPAFMNNENIRESKTYPYTEWEMSEYIKCQKDPLYFIQNYCFIQGKDGGFTQFRLYDFQKQILREFLENKFIIWLSPRQIGKCSVYSTIVKIRNKKTGQIEEISMGELFGKRNE